VVEFISRTIYSKIITSVYYSRRDL